MTKTVLGHIDCPTCGTAKGMRITLDRNEQPFGFCEEGCGQQLRVGGNPRRVRQFVARHPWAAAAPVTVTVPETEPAAAPVPAPVPAAPVPAPAASPQPAKPAPKAAPAPKPATKAPAAKPAIAPVKAGGWFQPIMGRANG